MKKQIKKQSRVKNFLKSLDIYAKPINLTFKGKEKFRSTIGGFLSFLVLLFIVSIFIYKLRDMILKNQTQVKKNSLVSLSNSYSPPENLSKRNITIAFKVSDFWNSGSLDNSYHGSLLLRQAMFYIKQNETDGTSYREFNFYTIPYSNCKLGKNIFYENTVELDQFGISDYYCPDWNNLTLQGDWNSPAFGNLQLLFIRCSGSNCSSDSEFEQWINQITIQQIVVSSYFDISNYDEPIKYYLEDSFIPLKWGLSIIQNIYFKVNEIQLHDDIFGIFNFYEKDYFYQKSNQVSSPADHNKGPGQGIYLYQIFRIDKEYDIYERKVFTITGVLQDVGGLYNSIFFVGLILYSKFLKTLYFSSLISKIYQVEQSPDIPQHQEPQSNLKSQRTDIGSSFQDSHVVPSTSHKLKGELLKQDMKPLSIDIAKQMKEYLSNRCRLNLDFKDMIMMPFRQSFICCGRRKSQSQSFERRKLRFFEKGAKKTINELDCINLITKLRELKILSALLLTLNQRFMMKYSKRNLIEIQCTDSSSEEEKTIDRYKIQKINNIRQDDNQDEEKINNQKVNQVIDEYSLRQIGYMDQKILLGLLTKNPTLKGIERISNPGETSSKKSKKSIMTINPLLEQENNESLSKSDTQYNYSKSPQQRFDSSKQTKVVKEFHQVEKTMVQTLKRKKKESSTFKAGAHKKKIFQESLGDSFK